MIKNPKAEKTEPPKQYTFDSVFDWNTAQIDVYNNAARPIVDSVMEGYNGTVFAYGQTGTGKTFSMKGIDEPPELRGIIPNSFQHVFDAIDASEDADFLVRASFLEIYNEEIRDLLGKNSQSRLEVKESVETGVYVKDLTSFVVKGVAEINNVLAVGDKNRTVGATLMNQDSSRSHSIFSITVERSDHGGAAGDDGGHIRVGKLNLVDLAGSERQSKTGATGERLKEATKINMSLSALGNVISALVDSKSGHIPYRDSKLTRLLQDSLGGNTKTVMVANIGPAGYNFDETISTLRYANRAKNIKNKPRINEDPKDAMLREFQDEISRLKSQLQKQGADGEPAGAMGGPGVGVGRALSMDELTEMKEKMRQEIMASITKSPSKSPGKGGAADEGVRKMRAELMRKAEKEKAALAAEKDKSDAEKAKLAAEMEQRQAELQKHLETLEKEREEKEAIQKRLAAMESKVLHGDENLFDRTEKQEALLKAKEHALTEQKRAQEEQAHHIAQLEEERMMQDESYANIQDEVEAKTRKLKKLFNKYQAARTEVADLEAEFQQEREDMLDTIRTLQQQLKLKGLVVDAFIPPEEVNKIMSRAQWDEESEQWLVQRIDHAGNVLRQKRPISATSQRRPTSDYAKAADAMGDFNPRYRSENILNLDLDMPERTTYDYEGPGHNPRVQAALNAAFADDVYGMQGGSETMGAVYFSYDDFAGNAQPKKERPRSAKPKRPGTAGKRRTK